MAQFNFKAIGTTWQIDIYQELSKAAGAEILSNVMARIELFDKAYSRFRDDSLVTKISKEIGSYVLPDDAEAMMSLYQDLYKRTDGLVTPLIGNLISDTGYDAEYSLITKEKLESPPDWEDALDYKHPVLVVKKPVLLDFGAAGKGYLIDLVAKVLEENGVHEYCIDAGGDIIHRGRTPIRAGLEDPIDTTKVVGVYSLQNNSICGSAGNRRKWGKFTHIINPKTLSSPTDIIAVWVVAKSTLLADALTTCLFFVPASTLTSTHDFEYILIRKDRSVETSANFKGELFTT